MARKSRWSKPSFDRGVAEFRLTSWKYFSDFVNQEMLDYTTYIYRGHGNASWKLQPTLDRTIESPVSPTRERHLERFKQETRGRRGRNPPSMQDENDWWALGQHHGLLTPLLDWTESPFVALYFAATSAFGKNTTNMAVFAAAQIGIRQRNAEINKIDGIELINGHKPTVKIVRPQSDENSRLVSQRGLFTRGPNNVDLTTWMKKFHLSGDDNFGLMKIIIPCDGLSNCLRYLNRMNINHSTLFPDLTGASEHCNRYLEIKKY
jgi:hypothetical protein